MLWKYYRHNTFLKFLIKIHFSFLTLLSFHLISLNFKFIRYPIIYWCSIAQIHPGMHFDKYAVLGDDVVIVGHSSILSNFDKKFPFKNIIFPWKKKSIKIFYRFLCNNFFHQIFFFFFFSLLNCILKEKKNLTKLDKKPKLNNFET